MASTKCPMTYVFIYKYVGEFGLDSFGYIFFSITINSHYHTTPSANSRSCYEPNKFYWYVLCTKLSMISIQANLNRLVS